MQDTKIYKALALAGTTPFIAGAHWGTCLCGRCADSFNLFVISNVIFLVTWFTYVGASIKVALGMQILAFLTLLFIDLGLKSANVISAAYLRMRALATLIAVVSLLIVIAR